MPSMTQPNLLERAFALARSGRFPTVRDIRQELKKERFDNVEAHIAGPSLVRQLRLLCQAARAPLAA